MVYNPLVVFGVFSQSILHIMVVATDREGETTFDRGVGRVKVWILQGAAS